MRRTQLSAIEAVLLRQRQPFATIVVRTLSPVIGAEVEGVDLRNEPSEQEVAELRRALAEHHVLVFRDHAVSAAQHGRIAAMLGFTPEPGRRRVTIPAGDPALNTEQLMMAATWRTDETYRSTPPAGGVLHVERMPRGGAGGDLLFANMHLAYELLSPQLKALLADLTAVHAPDPAAGAAEVHATAQHPVVVRHPMTGRPTLFVNRAHTSHIVQLDAEHSEMTVDLLCRQLEAHPVLTCRIRLTPGALVVWDSRSTQHLALPDLGLGSLSGHLVSLAGDRPVRWEA
jgi:taurine dioxygenase